MKRIFIILLSLIYFVASNDLLLRQHYCMGDLVEANIDLGQMAISNFCGDCNDVVDDEAGCCESKTKLLKKVEVQKLSQLNELRFNSVESDLLPFFSVYYNNSPIKVLFEKVLALLKPPPKSVLVFLANRNIRI